MNVNERKKLDVISFCLHNVRLENQDDIPIVDSILKTYNSVARCSFKRFQSMGLANLMKGYKKVVREFGHSGFKNCPFVNGRPCEYERPVGMSPEMWSQMRLEAYNRKRAKGLANANQFWQRDKDMGHPISGTMAKMQTWVKDKGYELDSTLLHDAVMDGYRSYISFERRRSRWQTTKDRPAFGDVESRSRKDITEEEFQRTRNGSMTVVGKSKVGNPKFKFDLEKETISFIFKRKKIEFNFASHRFSKKGYAKFQEIVGSGEPITVTLKKLGADRFNISISYAPMADKKSKSNRVSAIYVTGQVLCHQVQEGNRILHSKTYNISKLSGENKNQKNLNTLLEKKDYEELKKQRRRLFRKKSNLASEILNKVFNINKSLNVDVVVVETPASRTKRNFNNALIEFKDKGKIERNSAKPCFIPMAQFNKLVKSQCAKRGMQFKKVNGTFIQMKAVLESNTMEEATRNACSSLVKIHNGWKPVLTDWLKLVHLDPSMLDWVRHLLHNKRNRHARWEVRRAFQKRAVERAACLLDIRTHSCRA